MNSAASSSNVHCPRCGYDQRGAMATWDEKGACPLEGTCAECGLTFDWIDLINPSRIKPMWCVEYSRGLLGMAASVFKTAAHQVVPCLFWKRVRMHHKPRFGRIAIYLVVALLTIYLALMISQASAAWREYHEIVLWSPVPPPPQGFNPAPPPPPPPVPISEWHAVAWTTLLPFSATSPGTYRGAFLEPFPTPIELLKQRWATPFYHDRNGNLYRAGFLASFWFALLVFMPMTFALLPETRRAAKVRWSHIIRIGLYFAAFTAPLSWWALLWGMPRFVLPVVLFVNVVSLVWWGFACSRYLHLPRQWLVASLLTLMLLLACIAIQYYSLYEPFARHVLGWG